MTTIILTRAVIIDQKVIDRVELRPGTLPLAVTADGMLDALAVRNALAARIGLAPSALERLQAFDLALLLHLAAQDSALPKKKARAA